MRIVPSADIGALGPQVGTASIYIWQWYYSLLGLAIWFALIFAFVVPKLNRDYRVLLILIPLVIVNLCWLLLKKITYMLTLESFDFGTVFHSMAVGVTILWLIAYKLKNLSGLFRFLTAFGMMIGIAFLGIVSVFPGFSTETIIPLAFFVFMAFAMLLAIAISSRLCRGKYHPIRFMLWLGIGMILICELATFGFLGVGTIIMVSGPPSLSEAIVQSLLIGLMFGVMMYVLNLPYLILGFINPFFRERFLSCLRLKSVTEPISNDSTDQDIKRN